jgi:hypothetical protein
MCYDLPLAPSVRAATHSTRRGVVDLEDACGLDEAATPRNLQEDLKIIGAQHVCHGPFSQSWK